MRFSLGSSSCVHAALRQSSSRGTAIFGLLLLVLVAGCRSTPKTPVDPGQPGAGPYATARDDAVPPWLGEPLSWEKLERVELWLDNEGRNATPQWRNEAELTLNSGRLEFARRDLDQASRKGKEKPAAVATRVRAAKFGFDRLALRSDLNVGQRRRAEEGVAQADRILSGATRTTKGRTTLAVVPRTEWGALKAKPALMDRTVGAYTRITVHHSADNDPVVLDGSAARSFEAVRDIQRAHMNGKDTHYGDIGYHFLIDPDGRVIEGRDLTYQGAHAMGDNNVRNVGICLIGNFDIEKPSEAALAALRRILDDLRAKYGIDKDHVYGHRDLRNTRCPGENLTRWLNGYRGGSAARITVQAAAPQAAVPRNSARTLR